MVMFGCKALIALVGAKVMLLCLLLFYHPAYGGEPVGPEAIIKVSNARILEIYKTSPGGGPELQQKVFQVMEEVTDFAAIAERATTGFCEPAKPQICDEFKKVFVELLQRNAVRKLGHYRADRFDYQGEEITGDKAVIKTVAHYREDSVQLHYFLEKQGKDWRIVNYIADEVDTIQNYRRQFKRLLGKGTLVDLVARLKKKNQEYREEKTE